MSNNPLTATRLQEALSAVCPVVGARRTGPASGSYDPDPAATAPQVAAADAALASFDWSDAAQAAWEAARNPDRKNLRDAASQAVADIDTYLAAADAGTAAQQQARDHAQFKRLNQMVKAVIKRLAQID